MDIVQMTIRLDSDLHKACLEKSDEAGQTLAEWIRRAMKEKLEREDNARHSDIPLFYADDDTEFITKKNLVQALRELKKEGFSFENL